MIALETSRTQTADGTTLAVHTLRGEGQPLLAIHGFTGNAQTMIPLVDACRNGRPAILIDCIGHGASDAPNEVQPYSMPSVVDQILGLVGMHPPGHVHLLGYSMGGRIALSMAARAPWYFASLTTLSASPGLADPIERARRYDEDHARAAGLEHQGIEAFVDSWLDMPLFASLVEAFDDDARAVDRRQRLSNSVIGLANSLRGTGTGSMPPVWQQLPGLRTPYLAIAGADDDRYARVANDAAAAAAFGRAIVIPNLGHALHAENPGEVAPFIADFLEGCETDATAS